VSVCQRVNLDLPLSFGEEVFNFLLRVIINEERHRCNSLQSSILITQDSSIKIPRCSLVVIMQLLLLFNDLLGKEEFLVI
jgi:hypothetical protein